MTLAGAILVAGSALIMFLSFSAGAMRGIAGDAVLPSWIRALGTSREGGISRGITVTIGLSLAILSQILVLVLLLRLSDVDAPLAGPVLVAELVAAFAWMAWLLGRWTRRRRA